MKTRSSPKYTMVFDTETTGLPLKKTELNAMEEFNDEMEEKRTGLTISRELKSIYDFRIPEKYPIHYNNIYCTDKQPYMTQLSFVILDDKYNIVFYYDEFLKIPENVEISAFVTNLTGITKEKCNNGVEPIEALKIFVTWFLKCEKIVAHNIQFDRTIVRIEITRHKKELSKDFPYINVVFSMPYDCITKLDHFDTMIRGIKICGIMVPKVSGEGKKLKMPKLVEMYKIFFHETPKNLHNSMVDVLVTMRCYLKLIGEHRDIDDRYFDGLIQNALDKKDIKGHLVEYV